MQMDTDSPGGGVHWCRAGGQEAFELREGERMVGKILFGALHPAVDGHGVEQFRN